MQFCQQELKVKLAKCTTGDARGQREREEEEGGQNAKTTCQTGFLFILTSFGLFHFFSVELSLPASLKVKSTSLVTQIDSLSLMIISLR